MGLFYQINFTAQRQTRSRTRLYGVVFILLCLLAGAGYQAAALWREANKPMLLPRLARYQASFAHVAETYEAWQRAFAAYQEIRPYVEKDGQLPPWRLLCALDGLSAAAPAVSPLGERCLFLPTGLTVVRGGGVTVEGRVPLPTRDKTEHLAVVKEVLTALATNALPREACGFSNAVFTVAWSKEALAAEDREIGATLHLKFPESKARAYPAPPSELAEAVKQAAAWRGKVSACRVPAAPGKEKELREVGAWLSELVLKNRSVLGDGYEEVRRLAEQAVDPMAVTRAVRERGGTKVTADVTVFEEAWKALALRQWRRERTLDCPELDVAATRLERLSAALPRREDFESGLAHVESNLRAFATGVLKKHVTEEETFWERVLAPAVRSAATPPLVPQKDGKLAVDPQAARVDFPFWKVSFGAGPGGAARQEAAPSASLPDLRAVLQNLETNSAGTWVTQVTVAFDTKAGDPVGRWRTLRHARIEGRVPCWLENGTQP
jgi:hypothetical protein